MELLVSILRFLGILLLVVMVFNLMIIVHEWGHFLAGRWRKLHIDRFQIWFGKPIWKKTYNGVQYGLGTIPAGGFVSLPQMAPMESIEGDVEGEDKRSLPPISALDKIIVAFAGPFFSFLLAVAFAVVVWGVKKPVSEAVGTTVIGTVLEDTPAEAAGLQVGDRILSIDGQPVVRFHGMDRSVMWSIISSENDDIAVEVDRPGTGPATIIVSRPSDAVAAVDEGPWYSQVWTYVSERPPLRTIGIAPMISPVVADVLPHSPADEAGLRTGDVILRVNGREMQHFRDVMDFGWTEGEAVELTIRRGNRTQEVELEPRVPEVEGTRPVIGVIFDAEGIRKLVRENPATQVANSFTAITRTLRAVFSPKSDVSAGHLSGPVGIMGLYYDLFQHKDGWRLALWFSVLLNVNLAILNLLPFPVLDGGHIVMAAVEWIRRKPLPLRFLEVLQMAFVFLLLGFMAYVTLKDVGDRVPRGKRAPAESAPQFLPPEERSRGTAVPAP